MASNRINRINEEIQKELSNLLRSVKDPRISDHMISIIRCEVTNDLRWCKVYLSILGDYDAKEVKQGLKSCSGWLRRELAHALRLRYTPELVFVLDDSIAEGLRMSKLISDLNIKPAEDEEPEDGEPV